VVPQRDAPFALKSFVRNRGDQYRDSHMLGKMSPEVLDVLHVAGDRAGGVPAHDLGNAGAGVVILPTAQLPH
jgi:hypothetical protein